MFKYRFACSNKDNILFSINQIIANDSPCGKSIFGGDLYKSGIHFEKCEEPKRISQRFTDSRLLFG